MFFFKNYSSTCLKGILCGTALMLNLSCSEESVLDIDDSAEVPLLLGEAKTPTTVNTTNHKEHDFDDSDLGPFIEDQGFTGSDIFGEGLSFVNSTVSGKMLKIHWKESEYDGTRRERGHEIKLAVTTNSELFSGFYFRADKKGNLLNQNTIIWQLYNWNSAGCSNWTSHLELKDNDLYLSYRSACVSPTVLKIYDNIEAGRNYNFQIRANISGNNTGRLVVKLDGTIIADPRGINFGFGSFDSNDNAETSVVGVKMGMYCYETSNYVSNEERILYLDNVGACVRTGTVTNSWDKIDPANGN